MRMPKLTQRRKRKRERKILGRTTSQSWVAVCYTCTYLDLKDRHHMFGPHVPPDSSDRVRVTLSQRKRAKSVNIEQKRDWKEGHESADGFLSVFKRNLKTSRRLISIGIDMKYMDMQPCCGSSCHVTLPLNGSPLLDVVATLRFVRIGQSRDSKAGQSW